MSTAHNHRTLSILCTSKHNVKCYFDRLHSSIMNSGLCALVHPVVSMSVWSTDSQSDYYFRKRLYNLIAMYFPMDSLDQIHFTFHCWKADRWESSSVCKLHKRKLPTVKVFFFFFSVHTSAGESIMYSCHFDIIVHKLWSAVCVSDECECVCMWKTFASTATILVFEFLLYFWPNEPDWPRRKRKSKEKEIVHVMPHVVLFTRPFPATPRIHCTAVRSSSGRIMTNV